MQCLDFGTFHLRFSWQSNFIVFIPCFQSSWAWCSCSVTDQDRNLFLGKTWIASQIFSATFQWCFARGGRWLARLKRDKVFTLVVLLFKSGRVKHTFRQQSYWMLLRFRNRISNNISMALQMCSEYINLTVWRDVHNANLRLILCWHPKEEFLCPQIEVTLGRLTHSQLPVLTILSLLDSSPKS